MIIMTTYQAYRPYQQSMNEMPFRGLLSNTQNVKLSKSLQKVIALTTISSIRLTFWRCLFWQPFWLSMLTTLTTFWLTTIKLSCWQHIWTLFDNLLSLWHLSNYGVVTTQNGLSCEYDNSDNHDNQKVVMLTSCWQHWEPLVTTLGVKMTTLVVTMMTTGNTVWYP